MSSFFSGDNETNAKAFAQEGEKLYQDYEQGTGGGSAPGQQGQQAQGGGYQQDMKDAEAAFQGGEKFVQGEEQNF